MAATDNWDQNKEVIKVVVFQLAEKEYMLKVDVVESIERTLSITNVPLTPSYVKGVVNLRGVITPIIDLRARFELEMKPIDEDTRNIIVSCDEFKVGLIVDAATDVIDIPKDSIEPQPKVVGSVESEFIYGVARIDKRILVMLNLNKVLIPVKRVTTDEY
ncbi:chemotaxis protein CheW [Sporosarcina thermotolerans]|uniref:Chemotaxis protein CheW n=1 Tax=Sporosarcina thermotolerans TaxID=633404 RepID=A0AAW9A9A3_9BACL|nr:chemotaxis protein CheW [Sporosarcina thermotolerans]MDW0115713.1 chemotaxis protein CheW [Sporosarcina thermotolerans]WHT47028.1 chemotaxis protein CheW [Sporosarcina thermotolerans]